MYQRRYDKVFIMLRQEMNGFSLGQRQVWGSSTMEIKNGKGRLSISVQGLRPLENGKSYTACLVAGQGEEMQPIFCDALQVDAYGKGNLQWEFNPDKIGEGAFLAEDLHTLLILAKDDGKTSIQAPLAGYFGDRVNWKKAFLQEGMKEQKKKVIPSNGPEKEKIIVEKEIELPKEVPVLFQMEEKKATRYVEEKKEKNIEPEKPRRESSKVSEMDVSPKKSKEGDFHNNFRDMLVKFQEELQLLEKAGILQESEIEKIKNNGLMTKVEKQVVETKQNIVETNQNIVETKDEMALDFMEMMQDLFSQRPTAENVNDKENRQWRMIENVDLCILPKQIYKERNNLLFLLAQQKYHHYILGKDGKNGYYFGLPVDNLFVKEELPQSIPFKTMLPYESKSEEETCIGYWTYKL